MKYIGLDPGYARLGFGVIESRQGNRRPSLIEAGIISTEPAPDDNKRLVEIDSQLQKLFSKYKGDIAYAAMENVFFRKDLTTGVKLIQARGVIMLNLGKFDIPTLSVTPTAMKKMVTGYGKAGKKQIQSMIMKLLSLQSLPQPDDAADALGLSLCAWLHHRSTRLPGRNLHANGDPS